MEVLHHKGVKNEFVLFFGVVFAAILWLLGRIHSDFRESLIHMCQFGSFFPHQSEEDFPFWSMAFTGSYLYYKIVR